uniref:Uncharacterized protein n=1 Tax=Panagrolaimus superbus TaxID=310955 RepID=A0A914ZDA3_9BILA
MDDLNNINLTSRNQDPPAKHTLLSNNITQFLIQNTSTTQKLPLNNNANSGDTEKKKTCKVKKIIIADDIEMVEEDSEAEEENVVSRVVASATPPTTPYVVKKENEADIVDIDATGDNDIFMSEVSDVENFDISETPVRQSNSSALKNTKNSRILTTDAKNDADKFGENKATKRTREDKSDNHVVARSSPRNSNEAQYYTAISESSLSETRKVSPKDYEYGFTKAHVQNGRLIVFEENDRSHVREYSRSNISGTLWYCRFCFSISRSTRNLSSQLNDDQTFDALVNHICKPITYEESKRDEEKIKRKIGTINGSQKRTSRVYNDTFEDSEADDSAISTATPGRLRSGRARTIDASNYRENDNGLSNIGTESNQSGLSGSFGRADRRSNNRTVVSENLYAETCKVSAENYEYGLTQTNTKNGRLIVFEENDRSHVREYTHYNKNAWYCRFCDTLLRSNTTKMPKRFYGYLNDDKTFDALIYHVCEPITYEESKRDQEKIKEKNVLSKSYSHNNPSRRSHVSTTISESAETRKVSAENYEFGFSITHRENGRLIVFEENDRTHVREYTNYNKNAWYYDDDEDYEGSSVSTTMSRTLRSRTIDASSHRENDNGLTNIESNQSEHSETFGHDNADRRSNNRTSTPRAVLHQEVPSTSWQYGYDSCGISEKRIIALDPNNQRYAHEYESRNMKCVRCSRIENTCRYAKFDEQNKLFVPTNHICTPKLYTKIKEQQEKFAEKHKKSKSNEFEDFRSSRSQRSRIENESLRQQSDTTSLNPQNAADNIEIQNEQSSTPKINSVFPAASPLQIPSSSNTFQRCEIKKEFLNPLTMTFFD